MPKRPRSVTLGITALCIAVAVAVVPELRHQPDTLLDRAHKVTPLGTWDSKRSNYLWLSDQEVLLITPPAAFAYPTPTSARSVSLATEAATEDTALEAALDQTKPDSAVTGLQLSPDAKWLLCHDYTRFWVINLNKPRLVSRPFYAAGSEDGSSTAWLPGAGSWVEAVEGTGGVTTHNYLYRVNSPVVTDHVGDFDLEGLQIVGFCTPTRVLTLHPYTGDGGGVSMADYDAISPANSSRFHIEHVPPNMDVQEVVLSPDGTRLAWKFAVKPLPLGLRATINSNYVHRSSPTSAGLWVSDLNCNNLQAVGTLDIRDDDVTSLRWLPDGKRLSFISRNALYTVPVN